ncbi:MAG: outer membrane protein assembly factor BamD [Phycisphaerae bacterium]|nr:outer membrane protein assembly factor BamD [Phycisphaerae bacterium]
MARSGTLTLIVMLGLGSVCLAGEDEETYHERLEFDAATGQWVPIAPPIPGTDAGELAMARSLLARGEYKKARKAFKDWFKAYPESPNWPEALFYAAETEVMAEDSKPKKGDLIKAYEWLEELLEDWPGTELADRAIRKEMIIAEMLLFKDRKQRVWRGLLWLSGKEEALQMLDRIIDDWARDTPVAEQALRLKGDYHYINGEFDEAELAYARLARDFPRGRYHKIAMLRSGESAFARFPGVEFDDADLLEAEVYFTDFQGRYPRDAAESGVPQRLNRIRESRAHKEYTIGRYYERTREVDAATYYYRLVEQNWPATTWAAEARNRLVALGVMEPRTAGDE